MRLKWIRIFHLSMVLFGCSACSDSSDRGSDDPSKSKGAGRDQEKSIGSKKKTDSEGPDPHSLGGNIVPIRNEISRALTKFSSQLFDVFLKQGELEKKSFIFSPYSIHILGSMLCLGAGGKTKSSLLKGLAVDSTDKLKNGLVQQQKHFRNVSARMTGKEDEAVVVSNHMYMNDGVKLSKSYQKTIKEDFSCDMGEIDSKDTKKTAEKINKQVEKDTHGEITDLVEPKDIKNVVILLVNAVLFNGTWDKEFADEGPEPKDKFHLPNKECQKILLMNKKENFRYMLDTKIKAHVFKLEYKELLMSMVIILPTEKRGIDSVQTSLLKHYSGNLTALFDKLDTSKHRTLILKFPKFEIEQSNFDLEGVMKKMGMESMFDKNADFTKMTSSRSVYVSSMYQQAKISVNWKGTLASAATVATMSGKMLHEVVYDKKPLPITVDHPFLFFIKDNTYNTILFYGRFSGGSEKSGPC